MLIIIPRTYKQEFIVNIILLQSCMYSIHAFNGIIIRHVINWKSHYLPLRVKLEMMKTSKIHHRLRNNISS